MIVSQHYKISLLIIALTLSSCSMAPDYERPKVELAEQYSQGNKRSEELNWSHFFKDPVLKQLIDESLESNKNIQALGHQVEAARALYGIKKADQLPSLGVGGNVSRLKIPETYSQSPYIPSYMTSYQATLGISSWELDFWGKLESLKRGALEKFFASVEAKRAAELSLVSQVAQSYLFHRELQERLDLATKSLNLRKKSFNLFKKKFKVGSGSKLDVTQSEILYNQARGEKVAIERELALNENALRVLIGGKYSKLDSKSLSDVEKDFARDIPNGLPSDLLQNRPDIMAAEHLLKAQNYNIGAARAAFFPSISLTGSYGQVSNDLNDLFDSNNGMWLFRPSINIPLFTGGKLTNQLEAAKAQKSEAIAKYELSIQKAFREVSDVLAQKKWINEQLDILNSTLAAQKERARLSHIRYKNGATSYLEVLDAERALFSVEQSMVEIRRAALSSNITLFAALGGSYQEKETKNKEEKNKEEKNN